MTLNDPSIPYAAIAEAEASIIAAGYIRDQQHHVWVRHDDGARCKVVRTVNENNIQFFVQKA